MPPARAGDDGHLAGEVEPDHGGGSARHGSVRAAHDGSSSVALGDDLLGHGVDLGRERPPDVVGQVEHRLADLLLGQLAAFEGRPELDLHQLGLAQGGQHADGHQPAVADVELGPGPHRAEQVVDGEVDVRARRSRRGRRRSRRPPPSWPCPAPGASPDRCPAPPAHSRCPARSRPPPSPAPDHAGSAIDLVSRYSSNPATPDSRPTPDCL